MKIQVPSSNRRYVSKDDIGTREIPVTIASVDEAEFPGGERKTVLSFVGKRKKLVAGAPIIRALVGAWGDETSEWVGREAVLYVDPAVMFGGQQVGGLRLRPLPAAQQSTTATLRTAPHPVATVAVGDDANVPF